MTAFEIFLYAIAILAVLWLRAEPQVEATPIAPLPVVDDFPTLEELMAEAEALIAKPLPPRTAALVAQAAEVATPVAVARVEVPSPDDWIAEIEVEQPSSTDYLRSMTSVQLRKECSRQGIAWRGVREGGKHLTKPQMLKALGA
ncbi:hypothetical protein VB780_25965 [Leptolyngbya sp. CCNP1308]|uniref:hypothetical protein n=1 Tax=Leptolyngbya sp. CCNP1308 TaxID=3110255 RepID=UPI002B206699|nr:hypothetical protein [Leptolyngbya sp. CCNP1308]MEA5452047.1 hypothetical protein [Leptolyngbya sp. CCNP1308]